MLPDPREIIPLLSFLPLAASLPQLYHQYCTRGSQMLKVLRIKVWKFLKWEPAGSRVQGESQTNARVCWWWLSKRNKTLTPEKVVFPPRISDLSGKWEMFSVTRALLLHAYIAFFEFSTQNKLDGRHSQQYARWLGQIMTHPWTLDQIHALRYTFISVQTHFHPTTGMYTLDLVLFIIKVFYFCWSFKNMDCTLTHSDSICVWNQLSTVRLGKFISLFVFWFLVSTNGWQSVGKSETNIWHVCRYVRTYLQISHETKTASWAEREKI